MAEPPSLGLAVSAQKRGDNLLYHIGLRINLIHIAICIAVGAVGITITICAGQIIVAVGVR